MERDPKISKLIKEGGVKPAPEEFTAMVMDRIAASPEKSKYKPLIGWGGRIMIILFVVSIVIISVIYSDPGTGSGTISGILDRIGFLQLDVEVSYNFFSNINFSTGLISAVLAIFILVLSDAGFNRRRLI